MKFLLAIALAWVLGCNNKNQTPGELPTTKAYSPGLGEFMTGIQVHHAKLWFAGTNENWELADFEMHEIGELVDDIRRFNADREEIKSIGMINGPLDSVSNAINQKTLTGFKTSFLLLTKTCNDCHKNTAHGFNVVKVPDQPPFSNQEFKPQ